jgi:hypothetical protein
MFGTGTAGVENPGEQSRLELAASLSTFGTVSIDPVAEVYGMPYDRSVRLGKSYTDKAPGVSFAGAPITWSLGAFLPRQGESPLPRYWPLRNLLIFCLVALPAAVFPFLAMKGFTGLSPQRKVPFAILFALCTPLLTYASVLLSHVPAGLLATLAFVLLVRPGQDDTIPSPRTAGLGGLALAAAVTTEYPTALFGLVLLPTMLLRRVPLRTLAICGIGFAIGMVPCLIYHDAAFGSWLSTGYSFKNDAAHMSLHQTGFMGVTLPNGERLWGVLAGAKRGVLFYCPLLALIPIGLWQMNRARKHSATPFAVLSGIYIFFAAGFIDWQAGWCAAARHLLPWIILSIYPLAAGVQHMDRPGWRRWVLLVCVALSVTGSLLSVSLTPFFPEHFQSPFGQLVLPLLSEGYVAPTMLASANLDGRVYALGGVIVLVLGAVGWALIRLSDTTRSRALIPVVLVAIVTAYTGLIWSLAPPLAANQVYMQERILDRIGYGPTDRKEN